MARTLVTIGQELVFVSSKTGRQTPVTVLAIGTPYADSVRVAQVGDTSKVRDARTSDLRTADGGFVITQADADESAKYTELNAAMAAPDRFVCLECGATHSRSTCPVCGGQDRIENVK